MLESSAVLHQARRHHQATEKLCNHQDFFFMSATCLVSELKRHEVINDFGKSALWRTFLEWNDVITR
jgi:hypothetical protein